MRARSTRLLLALVIVGVTAATAAADEPPSTPWSPPGIFAPPKPAAPSSAAPSSPAAGKLPAPSDAASDQSLDDEGDQLSGPWLIGGNLIGADEDEWYVPTAWLGGAPWDTGIELGLNGSTGNNESFSIRTGGYTKRESRFSKLDYSIYYNRTTTSEGTTQNNATTDIRNDWLLDDSSPWSLYTKANLFYDEFQAFELQTNGSTGIGYQIFKRPELTLTTRAGGGASREFGGPDNEWTPEALFGFEYEQHVSDTQKLYANLEYYPRFEDFGQYRLVTDGGWEIELSKPSNLSLKISANDRFDSTPNGADPHLVNYSVLLLLKL
jgi:putative salt-induced outer membrane protein YdiY